MRDTQLPDGEFPESAPRGPGQGCCDGGTAWSDGGVIIPWVMWERYGDTDLVKDHYESMEAYFAYLDTNFPDRIRNHGPYGDWLHLGDDTPPEVLGTAYYAYMANAMSEMAAAIGKDADAASYAEMAEDITQIFQDNFVSDDGTVEGNSQTAYALAIGMDLVPAELIEAAGEKLVAKVASRDYHLSTGFVGTPWLMPALSKSGNWDIAYRLLMNKTIPSWGYEVESGATTMWERWDSIDANGNFGAASMNSFNHYAFGAVGDWMYQNIGGIAVGDTGYKSTVISPHPGGGLTSANASLETEYGLVSTDWALTGGNLALAVSVPTNATATVQIPAANAAAVSEGSTSLGDAEGIEVLSSDGSVVSVRVGSGTYEFAVSALAEKFGAVIDSSTALQDTLESLDGIGGDVAHIDESLQEIIDAMQHGIGVLEFDRAAAIGDVLDSLTEIRALDDWIADRDIDVEARAVLAEATAAIEAQLDVLAAELSGISIEVDAGGLTTALPGQPITVNALLTNTGTEALSDLSATLKLDEAWSVNPAASPLVASLPAGESTTATFTATAPISQLPGEINFPVTVSYDYQGLALRVEGSVSVAVESGVVLSAVIADPASVLSNSKSVVTLTLQNVGSVPVSGVALVTPPLGWVQPVASSELVIDAGETATVSVELFVPATLDEQSLALPVTFARGDTVLASGTATVEAIVPAPAAGEALDHIDLGDGASEAAHGLTASPTSNTSMEAGVTRRYSGNAANSYFTFTMVVPKDAPFIIRAVETYDGARLKEYSVSVDGVEVQSRLFQRVTTGSGTDNYQILVDDPAAFSSTGSVSITMKHANSTTNYDPSIADAWTLPVTADVLAPSVSATVTRSGSAVAGQWSRGPVTVELNAADNVSDGLELEYRLDAAEDWSVYTEAVEVSEQGEHQIEYRARDAAGNESVVGLSDFAIDSIAPETNMEATTTPSEAAANSASVLFTATDAASGVASTSYAVDGGEWVAVTAGTPAALVLSGAGEHSVSYFSTDVAGNVEEAIDATVQIADAVAPTVAVELTGERGAGGWFVAQATATITASDADSAVQSIEYKLGDDEWKRYSSPLALPDGDYTLLARASDASGNTSKNQTLTVAVDTVAPSVWAWLSDADKLVSVTRDAGSRVGVVEYSANGTDWVAGLDALFVAGALPEAVSVRASDMAGNTSEVQPLTRSAEAPALSVEPGELLTIEASGFDTGARVRVELHPDVTVLGAATASAAGVIALDARVPFSTNPGQHRLVLVVVIDSGGGDPGGGSGEDDPVAIPVTVIASTGFDALPLALGAALLVLLGAGLVFWRRRRAMPPRSL